MEIVKEWEFNNRSYRIVKNFFSGNEYGVSPEYIFEEKAVGFWRNLIPSLRWKVIARETMPVLEFANYSVREKTNWKPFFLDFACEKYGMHVS